MLFSIIFISGAAPATAAAAYYLANNGKVHTGDSVDNGVTGVASTNNYPVAPAVPLYEVSSNPPPPYSGYATGNYNSGYGRPQSEYTTGYHGSRYGNEGTHHHTYTSHSSSGTDAMTNLAFGQYRIGFYYTDGHWYYGPYYQPGLAGLIVHGNTNPQPWHSQNLGSFHWDPIHGIASGFDVVEKGLADTWYSGMKMDPTAEYISRMKLPDGHFKSPVPAEEIADAMRNIGYGVGDFGAKALRGAAHAAGGIAHDENVQHAVKGMANIASHGGDFLDGGVKIAHQGVKAAEAIGKILPSPKQMERILECGLGACKFIGGVAEAILKGMK